MNKFSRYLSLKSILSFSFLNYIQAAISFFISFLLARELGKETYGLFALGLVFANTFSIIIQFGMDKTLVRDLVQFKNPHEVLIAATKIKLIISTALLIPTLIWLWFFSGFYSEKFVIVILATFSGTIWGFSPKAWFDFTGKIHLNAIINVVERLFYLVSSITILYYVDQKNIIQLVVTFLLISRILSSIVEWSYVLKTFGSIRLEIDQQFKTLIQSNVWIWIATLGNLMMTQANQIILERKTDLGELGLYGFSLQLIMMVRLFQKQIIRLTAPTIAVSATLTDPVAIKKKMFRLTFFTFGITVLILIPIVLVVPYFIEHYINEVFLEALPIFYTLCIWVSIFGVAMIINQFLIGLRLERYFMFITIFFGLFSLILAYLLIPIYNGVGAAMSLLISHSGSIIFQFILVIRKINSLKADV